MRLTAIAIGVTLAAFALRVFSLTHESLWWDEVVSLQQAHAGFGEMLRLTAADNTPPLHNLIVFAMFRLFGESEFTLRLPSAVLGSLNVLLVYWVGSLLGSRLGGLIAAILLAVAGFHIWYSQEGRAYALLCCAATAYAGCAIWVAQKPTWTRAIANVVAGSALLHSHAYGIFTFVAIGGAMTLLVLVRRRDWGTGFWLYVLIQAITALTFVPWALVLLGRAEANTVFWIPPVTPFRVLYYLIQLATGPVMLIAIFAGVGMLLIKPRNWNVIVLLGIWALGPLLLGVVASALTAPLLVQRYLIGSLPALLLIAGIGFTRLAGIPRVAGFVFVALAGLSTYIGFWPPGRTDFRDMAKELAAEFRPDDCLLIWNWAWIALDHYWDTTPACLLQTQGGYADIDMTGRHPRQIFVLLTNDEPTDDPALNRLGAHAGITDYGQSRLLMIDPAL